MRYIAMDLAASVEDFTIERTLHNLSPSSVEQYALQLNVFTRYLVAHDIIDTREITLAHVRSYLAYRKITCKQSSLCQQRSIVALWIKWLHSQGECSVRPDSLPSVSAPKADEIRRLYIGMAEARLLYNHLRRRFRSLRDMASMRDLLLFVLLFGVGLRVSEVANVRKKHIDLPARELFLPRTKGNRPRYAAIPESAVSVLRLVLRCRDDYLLLSRYGRPYCPTTLARRIARLAGECGIHLTSHTGRRYCITRLAAINLLAAQQQAGHKHIATTTGYLPDNRELLHATIIQGDPLR